MSQAFASKPYSGWKPLGLASLALSALACITINVYFPEAAVRDLSQKIEEAVAEEAAKDASGPSQEGTSAAASAPTIPELLRQQIVPRLLRWTASTAQAQQVVAPEISNPAIRKIIADRGKRLNDIQRLKSSGVVGETRNALLEIRSLESLELKARAQAQRLVKAENSDRERMFKEIAAATGTDLSQLPKIQATYARTLRENAAAGDWYQLPDGSWRQK